MSMLFTPRLRSFAGPVCALLAGAGLLAGCSSTPSHPTSAALGGGTQTSRAHTCTTIPTVPADEIVWVYPNTPTATLHVGQVLGVALAVPASSSLTSYPWAPISVSDHSVLASTPVPGSYVTCTSSQSLIGQRFAFRAVKAGTSVVRAAVVARCSSATDCGVEPLDLTVTVG